MFIGLRNEYHSVCKRAFDVDVHMKIANHANTLFSRRRNASNVKLINLQSYSAVKSVQIYLYPTWILIFRWRNKHTDRKELQLNLNSCIHNCSYKFTRSYYLNKMVNNLKEVSFKMKINNDSEEHICNRTDTDLNVKIAMNTLIFSFKRN